MALNSQVFCSCFPRAGIAGWPTVFSFPCLSSSPCSFVSTPVFTAAEPIGGASHSLFAYWNLASGLSQKFWLSKTAFVHCGRGLGHFLCRQVRPCFLVLQSGMAMTWLPFLPHVLGIFCSPVCCYSTVCISMADPETQRPSLTLK